jgi:hypothetical protein
LFERLSDRLVVSEVVVIVKWCDDRREYAGSDESRVPIYFYDPEPCTRSEDMSSHSGPLGSRQETRTRRSQCQCHALYSKDHERHVSCQRFSLLQGAYE